MPEPIMLNRRTLLKLLGIGIATAPQVIAEAFTPDPKAQAQDTAVDLYKPQPEAIDPEQYQIPPYEPALREETLLRHPFPSAIFGCSISIGMIEEMRSLVSLRDYAMRNTAERLSQRILLGLLLDYKSRERFYLDRIHQRDGVYDFPHQIRFLIRRLPNGAMTDHYAVIALVGRPIRDVAHAGASELVMVENYALPDPRMMTFHTQHQNDLVDVMGKMITQSTTILPTGYHPMVYQVTGYYDPSQDTNTNKVLAELEHTPTPSYKVGKIRHESLRRVNEIAMKRARFVGAIGDGEAHAAMKFLEREGEPEHIIYDYLISGVQSQIDQELHKALRSMYGC